jgi:hypothetical protein
MSEPATTVETRVVEEKRAPSSGTGATFGIVVFLAGIGLLLYTFKLAYDKFNTPPESALHIDPKKPLDIAVAGTSFMNLVIQVLLLIVMAIIGAIIANRGIKMYSDSRK